MPSRRFLAALASAAAAALAALTPMAAAHAAQLPQTRTACSASYLDGDYRLGPTDTPDAGADRPVEYRLTPPGDPAQPSVQWLLVHGYLAATN